MIKRSIPRPRLLDKCRAAYERERKWHLSLPPLLSVDGKVEVTDAIYVTLPTVNGKAVYTAVPVGGWRFEFDRQSYSRAAASAGAKASAVPAAAPPAASDAQVVTIDAARHKRLIQMNDMLLNEVIDLDRQVLAFEAKHLPSNVIHLSNVAAE